MDPRLEMALIDGGALTVGACVLIGLALRIHPRLFLSDFPPEMQARMGPKSRGERLTSVLIGACLLAWILGMMIRAALHAEAASPGASIWPGIAAFIGGMMFNAADWLLIDELWLGLMRPAWLFPEGVDPGSVAFSHRKHAADLFKGSLAMAVLAVAIGCGVWIL